MINFWFDEMDLLSLSKDEYERFFELNDKGLDEGLTEEEYEELIELNEKGKKQFLNKLENL